MRVYARATPAPLQRRPLPLARPRAAEPDLAAALAAIPGRNEIERRRLGARMLQLWRYLHSAPPGRTSLRDLSQVSGYSPWHLQRTFKRMFGVAPKAISALRKIEAAAQLVWTTDDSVELICQRTGFVNRSAFSRLFKKTYGLSPTEYRAVRDRADESNPFCDVPGFRATSSTVVDRFVSDSCDRGNHA